MRSRAPTINNILYIRVPSVLKRDVDKAAEKSGVSVNIWVQRRLEEATQRKKLQQIDQLLHENQRLRRVLTDWLNKTGESA